MDDFASPINLTHIFLMMNAGCLHGLKILGFKTPFYTSGETYRRNKWL